MTEDKVPITLPSLITIDPSTSVDLDDAVAANPTPDGGWIVDIGIADVTKGVRLGTERDIRARQLGYTQYRDGTMLVPMLGKEVTSNHSLLPRQVRRMAWVRITLDANLDITDTRISRVQHATMARFSYEKADILLMDYKSPYYNGLCNMWELAQELLLKRQAIWDPDLGIGTNDEGEIIRLESRRRHQSHLVIQELMILTNHALAKYAQENNRLILYRNHVPANVEEAISRRQALNLPEVAKKGPEALAEALKSYNMAIGPAHLSTVPDVHWGIGLSPYAWFTSPIRRYADIVNLRAILDGVSHPDADNLAVHLTKTFRHHKREEREAQQSGELKKATRVLQNGDLPSLRNLSFKRMVEACSTVQSHKLDLNEELARYLQAGMLKAEDVDLVLSVKEKLVTRTSLSAVITWLLTAPPALHHLLRMLQGRPSISSVWRKKLHSLTGASPLNTVTVIREFYHLEITEAEISERDKLDETRRREYEEWQATRSNSAAKRPGKILLHTLQQRAALASGRIFCARGRGTDINMEYNENGKPYFAVVKGNSRTRNKQEAARLILAQLPALPQELLAAE